MPFAKGNKLGNRQGRPQKNVDVQAIARLYTEDAMRVLKDIMQDDTATAASRVSAAEAILSRGWGKPAQVLVGNEGGPVAIQISWQPPQSPPS